MDMAALPRGSRAACLLLALCGAATGVGATGVVEFNSWLAKSGVANSKVKLAVDMGPGARGMVATADIAAGDSILDIPFSMLMTLNTAQNGPLKEVVNAKQLNPTVILALHLLDEKFNATSAFRPWLEMLPTTFETPIHWSDDELDELQGSTVFSVTKKRKETLQADYTNLFGVPRLPPSARALPPARSSPEQLHAETRRGAARRHAGVLFEEFPALFPRAAYTMEAYQWAISTVWSRSFVFNVEVCPAQTPQLSLICLPLLLFTARNLCQGNMVPVMVPFADMFEHANVDSSFSLEEGAGAFRITTGEQESSSEDPRSAYAPCRCPHARRLTTPVTHTGAAVKAGEKVFLSLGNKPNSQLLLSYGFVLTANEFDSVPINMFINDEDPFHDVKVTTCPPLPCCPPPAAACLQLTQLVAAHRRRPNRGLVLGADLRPGRQRS